MAAQLCQTFCDPMHCCLPGFSAHGISQARTLEWVAISLSRGPSGPGIEPTSLVFPALAGGLLTTSTTWEAPPLPQTSLYVSFWLRSVVCGILVP